jgi:hypothetical protein
MNANGNGGYHTQPLSHHHSMNASPDPASSFIHHHHDLSSTFTDGSGTGSEPSILFDSSFLDPSLILTPVTPPGSTPSTPAIHQFVKNGHVNHHQQQPQSSQLHQIQHHPLQHQSSNSNAAAAAAAAAAVANNSLFPPWVNEPLW